MSWDLGESFSSFPLLQRRLQRIILFNMHRPWEDSDDFDYHLLFREPVNHPPVSDPASIQSL